MNYIKSLKNCNDNEIGEKAKNLKIISSKTNFLIPKTLVLTIYLYNLLVSFNKSKNKESFNNIKYFNIPAEIKRQIIKKIFKIFKNKHLVVRSSTTCEDSQFFSFAGQYSTFLNIRNEKDLLKAIKICYVSLFSDNAKAYAEFKNRDIEKEQIAVLVQNVIKTKISGVIFTADPINNNKNKMIMEYGSGFGDKIVGGYCKPSYLEFLKNEKLIKKYPDFIKKLLKISLKLESIFNCPQDIEWGFDGKKIFIFQSRPITTLKNYPQKIKFKNFKFKKIGAAKIVCRGEAIGKLKIILNKNDYKKIKNNNIVFINRKFNIDIVKKLKNISGLIIVGGVLSHIAVIAREFNKPCLSCPVGFDAKKYHNKKIDRKSVV